MSTAQPELVALRAQYLALSDAACGARERLRALRSLSPSVQSIATAEALEIIAQELEVREEAAFEAAHANWKKLLEASRVRA